MELYRPKITRYIAPLREGGSMPALAEGDDGQRYVIKLTGSAGGKKVVVAELIGSLIARAFKFQTPQAVLARIGPEFGITEPDEEVRQLLARSQGLNVGLQYLSDAATFDPTANPVDPLTASKIVWLDAYLTNVDRMRQNPNMMVRADGLWLIDHGSSLMFHHSWTPDTAAADPFAAIRHHVLLPYASQIARADKLMRQAITPRTIGKIIDLVPDELITEEGSPLTPAQRRDTYRHVLTARLHDSHPYVDEAIRQHNAIHAR